MKLINSCIQKKFEHEKWHFLSYKDISRKILKIIDKHDFFEDFEKRIIKQYCLDISNLNCIISDKLKNDEDSFSFETDKKLAQIRIDDVYKKLKADKIMKKLERNVKRNVKRNDGDKIDEFTFKIEKGFSNNMPLISFKYIYKYNNDVKNVYSIGIQIQNNVLKRYAEAKTGKVNLLKGGYDKFFKNFAEIGLFDANYDPQNKTIDFMFGNNTKKKYETNMSPKKGDKHKNNKNSSTYNTYNDFIYQQMFIPPDISKLENEINLHLNYIESILSDTKEVFESMEIL